MLLPELGCSIEGPLSCIALPTRNESAYMETLDDEILLSVFEEASREQGHHMMRTLLPLVCKRWKDTIYSAQGRLAGALARSFPLGKNTDCDRGKGGSRLLCRPLYIPPYHCRL